MLAAYTWQPKMYEQMEKAGLSNADIYFTHYSLILGANAILEMLVMMMKMLSHWLPLKL